jgi:hypothetical protein
LASVLKQCGQVATILTSFSRPAPTPLRTSTFCMPSSWKVNSLPRRRGRVTGAGLVRAQDRELDAGGVQQLGEGAGDLLGPVLERAGAADPEQVLDVVGDGVLDDADLEGQVGVPLVAHRGLEAPGVAVLLEVAQHHAGLARERALDEHLVAAHVQDVVDVLDVDRALLDAGAAGGAAPQDVGVDDPALLAVPTSGRTACSWLVPLTRA